MRFLHRLPLRLVLAVVSHPWMTLGLSGLMLGVCVLLGLFRLPISTDQNKLFSSEVGFFRDYLQFIHKFPENEAIYVIVEPADPNGPPPPLERWTAAADAIGQRLRGIPHVVKRVHHKVPVEQLGDQGLVFEDPALVPGRFEEVKRFIPLLRIWAERPGPATVTFGRPPMKRFLALLDFVRSGSASGFLVRALGLDVGTDVERAAFLGALAQSWDRALADPTAPLEPGQALPDLNRLGAKSPRDLGYSYVPDQTNPSRHVLLVHVYPQQIHTSLTAVSETVEAIRAATAVAARTFPEFKVGITGRPALEADEMSTTDRDTGRAEVIALAAVFVGLVVMFRSVWLAVAAEVCLGVGIGWTFGWASLSVGELNLLSIVFLIALIGIGMDYLVQVVSRYRREVARRKDLRSVWVAVFRQVSAPITTACLGAAGAFFVSIFTRFKGAADLGVIAGGGLLLCLLSGYTVLPAMLTLLPLKVRTRRDPSDREGEAPAEPRFPLGAAAARTEPRPPGARLDKPSRPAGMRRWLVTPIIWLVLLAAGVPFALRARFDPNLINLQAPDLESVKLVRKIETWSAVVLSPDLDVLRRSREAVRGSPMVSGTDSVLNAYDNAAWLRQHAPEIPPIQWVDQPPPLTAADVGAMAGDARSLADHFDAQAARAGSPQDRATLADAAAALRAFAKRLSDETAAGRGGQAAARLSAWQTAFVRQLREMMRQFSPGPIDVKRLPDELRTHFVADDGTYALYVYPEGDLWQRDALEHFVTDVERRVASAPGGGGPPPTGIAVNMYHSTRSVRQSFLRATAYALALIVLLVLIDMRNLRQTLLAISVLAFGLPMLVALMGLLHVSWNFANFFGLPILIGAGHEYGVFMVHRYREALRDPVRRAWRGWDVSDWALLLCAYVTSSAFFFFWLLGHHRGLRSLGLVMALGTACIYLATVAVLRPLLKWRLSKA